MRAESVCQGTYRNVGGYDDCAGCIRSDAELCATTVSVVQPAPASGPVQRQLKDVPPKPESVEPGTLGPTGSGRPSGIRLPQPKLNGTAPCPESPLEEAN